MSPQIPEIGEQAYSGYTEVSRLDPDVLQILTQHRPLDSWAICDAFSTGSTGTSPNEEVLRYQGNMGWDRLPPDQDFQTAFHAVRDKIIRDAEAVLGSNRLGVMIQAKRTGPYSQPLDDYDKVPHLDFVRLDQRVLAYYLSTASPTKFFVGSFIFREFLDDYSKSPDFTNLKVQQPLPNQLVRAEGITCIHAPAAPGANRLFIRAFVESIEEKGSI